MEKQIRKQLYKYENWISDIKSSWVKVAPPMELADYTSLFLDFLVKTRR